MSAYTSKLVTNKPITSKLAASKSATFYDTFVFKPATILKLQFL